MTEENDYRPRLSVELSEESFNKLQRILPHGWRKPLFQALVDGVLSLYDKGGIAAVSAIITKHIDAMQVTESGVQRSTNGDD